MGKGSVDKRLGFTLVELLVVIAIIGILLGLLLPAFGRAKAKAQATVCMSNAKQLAIGWTTYTTDNTEKLMLNSSPRGSWVVKDYLTWGPEPINTNTAALLDAKLSSMAAYIPSAGVYKCPGDHYQSSANPGPRIGVKLRFVAQRVGFFGVEA